ncbi:MAG: hypothetical protein K8R68_10050, partial [Bacteroidales bacterium]|nr:hypothetical protein [Bacteroidales bacterium]
IDEVYSLYVGDEEGLHTLKHWLHDHLDGSQYGSIANFYTDMWVYTTLPPGTPEEGKSVVTAFGPYTGHSMTFIGWNDSIRYDYNNDGQYTNDIDINGDEVVNMKDWEIGGLKLVNSWGGEQFADSGFCYVMYKVLAEEKLDGGIWNKSVNMIDVKEDYSPMLTFKIQLKHNYRNKIKVIAGISEDTTDIWPAYTMDFPIFNYQGGGYYMQGGATEEDKNIEFGLDITHLLSYVENDSSVKFFLQVHENDPQNIGTGKIVSFSLMDYINGGQEIVCPETDVSLIENSFTTLSVIHNLTFDKVEIETNELPAYVPGEQYTHQLSATGGSSPYDWRILSRYTENQYEDDYPDIQGEELIPVGYLETHAIQPIGFSFPFYGELYDTIIIHTDGFIMFREKEYPLPYQVDDMLLFKFQPMLALFLNEDLMISPGYDNGLWYEGDENQAAFRWKVTIEADGYDYQLDFTAILYPDGKIEYYFNEFENPDLLNRITGVSKGDGINLEIAEFSNLLSTKSSQVVSYTSPNFLASMDIDGDGLLSVYPEANNIIYNLTIEVTDINNISATKNFQLSENMIFDYSVVSGDNNIIEYNETAIISFSIKNIGSQVLDDLMLSINNQNLFINLLDSTEYIGSINPGQTIQLPDAISFSVADSIPDNYDIILPTEFTGTDFLCEGVLIVNAYAPILVPGQPIISDNDNGRLDPGETVDLIVPVSNYGHSPISSVTGQLSTDDPNITIGNSGNLNFGDLANGQTSFDTISVSADENTPEGHLATFELSISASLNFQVTDSFALLIGRFPVLIIDLDPEWVSGPIIKSTIEELNVLHDYLYFIPENTEIYQN